MIKTATPPTTPPIIAPPFEDPVLLLLDGVLVGEAFAPLPARTEDSAVTPVGSVAIDVSENVRTSEVAGVTRDIDVCETGGVSKNVGVSEPVGASEVLDKDVEEGSDAVVDTSVEETVVGSGKVATDVVVVLGVTLGNILMTTAVVTDMSGGSVKIFEEPSSSESVQMPVVHGSMEQHPRKLPAVQTYHCLFPVQELRARGKRDSISNAIC